jgi:amidase
MLLTQAIMSESALVCIVCGSFPRQKDIELNRRTKILRCWRGRIDDLDDRSPVWTCRRLADVGAAPSEAYRVVGAVVITRRQENEGVGLKTTFGLVPLQGVFPVEPRHLDTVGPMAKDVDHVVQGMDLLQVGFVARYRAAVAANSSGKKIRIGRLYLSGTHPKIDKAVDDALRRAQFEVVALDQAFKEKWDQAKKDGNTLAEAGAWIRDRKYFDKLTGVSARSKAIIAWGEFHFATSYQNALRRQAAWQEALDEIFKKVDLIALPTLQKLPPNMPTLALSELQMLNVQNTVPVNFAGNPALAIPIPLNDKIVPTTSLQLVGRRFSEADLLNAGRLVEARSRI